MRYAIPAAALVGLVCLALTPVPVIWGLVIAIASLVLIIGIGISRSLDAALDKVMRRHAEGRRHRPITHGVTGIARRRKGTTKTA